VPDADAVYVPEQNNTYSKWLGQHPTGFVINAPNSGAHALVWHRADCEFIQVYEDASSTTNPKACSLNPGALAVWAVTHGGTLHYCQGCRDRWLKEQHPTG
jgi:hypothetical protein